MTIKLTHLTLIYGVAGAREKFEELCTHLIRSVYPDLERVRIVVGDGGIDAHDGPLKENTGISVYQIKYFPDGLGDSQKNQIRKSFRAIKENQNIKVLRWTLCLPIDLSIDEKRWFENWKKNQNITGIEICPIWDALKLESLLYEKRNAGIKEEFFRQDHLNQLRDVHGMLSRLVVDFDERVPKPEPLILESRLTEVKSRKSFEYDESHIVVEIKFCFSVKNVSAQSVKNWNVQCSLNIDPNICLTRKTFPRIGSGDNITLWSDKTILPTLSMDAEALFGLLVKKDEDFDKQIENLLRPATLSFYAISDNHVGEKCVSHLGEFIDFPELCHDLRASLAKANISFGPANED